MGFAKERRYLYDPHPSIFLTHSSVVTMVMAAHFKGLVMPRMSMRKAAVSYNVSLPIVTRHPSNGITAGSKSEITAWLTDESELTRNYMLRSEIEKTHETLAQQAPNSDQFLLTIEKLTAEVAHLKTQILILERDHARALANDRALALDDWRYIREHLIDEPL